MDLPSTSTLRIVELHHEIRPAAILDQDRPWAGQPVTEGEDERRAGYVPACGAAGLQWRAAEL